MNFYKSKNISFIKDCTKISKLCFYDEYYYFSTEILINNIELIIITEDEFNIAISNISRFNNTSQLNIQQITNNDLDKKLNNIEETQLTQLMALADIYEKFLSINNK